MRMRRGKMAAETQGAILRRLQEASQDLLKIVLDCKVNARKAEDPRRLSASFISLDALLR